MIILFSDIHLTDTPERATFPTEFFLTELEAAITRGSEDVTVVLLGDIFEILKSMEWIEGEVRPWQPCTQKHIETVERIMKGIIQANGPFFEGLRDLKERYPYVRFEYIPGNHDRPINTEMGAKARIALQAELPLGKTNGEKFSWVFVDSEHKLIAKHGHEWDTSNRYEEDKGTTAAFGDAVVIDLVLRLPLAVADILDIKDKQNDRLLWSLYEIDNIRPHTIRVIAQWLNGGLDQLRQLNKKAPDAICDAMTTLMKNLRQLALEYSFESFKLNPAMRFSTWALINKITMKGFLKVAHRIPLGEGERASELVYALDDFQSQDEKFTYLVSGHTHDPVVIPMSAVARSRPGFYINTGTWRRIRPVTQSLKVRAEQLPFACWDEGSIAIIYNQDEQQQRNLPAFDLQKLTRGI